MTYEEFEWHLLRLAYEDDVDRVRPSMLAYTLGLPLDMTNAYLEEAVHSGVLELEVADDGAFEYFVPGIDRSKPTPTPVWRQDDPPAQAADYDGLDGSVAGGAPAAPKPAPARRRPQPVPQSLKDHIARRYEEADPGGAMVLAPRTALEKLRVESSDDAFCDASKTMFMRQIRVYGVRSPQVLQAQVGKLFQSFGYRVVDETPERMRFERGSLAFLLALVPLFVLIVPLILYLFMYAMGRSTIQQEPVELDVQFRRGTGANAEPFWEIDMTFVALHGVVLGPADQQQLNREIDTLRDELQWALAGN